MIEVFAEVVAEEGSHGKGVVHDSFAFVFSGGGGFGAHGGAGHDTVLPGVGFVD